MSRRKDGRCRNAAKRAEARVWKPTTELGSWKLSMMSSWLLRATIMSSCSRSGLFLNSTGMLTRLFFHNWVFHSLFAVWVLKLLWFLQVSKALLGDYLAAQKKGKPMKGMGLEHINGPAPVIPEELNKNTLRDSKFQVLISKRSSNFMYHFKSSAQSICMGPFLLIFLWFLGTIINP